MRVNLENVKEKGLDIDCLVTEIGRLQMKLEKKKQEEKEKKEEGNI